MIKTKSIFDAPEEADGTRILVARFRPRGTHHYDKWIVEWAPSQRLLADWRQGLLTWEQYTQRYLQEMQAGTPSRLIAVARERSRERTFTLLCYERESDPHCHRHLLKRLIEL